MPVCSWPSVASSLFSSINVTSIADQMNWNIICCCQIPAFFLLQRGAPFSPEVFFVCGPAQLPLPCSLSGNGGREGVGGWVEPVCLLRWGSNSSCVNGHGSECNHGWPAVACLSLCCAFVWLPDLIRLPVTSGRKCKHCLGTNQLLKDSYICNQSGLSFLTPTKTDKGTSEF